MGAARRKRRTGSPVGVTETCLSGTSGGASRVSGPGRLCSFLLRFVGSAEQRGAAAAATARAGSGGCRGLSHGRDGGAAAAAG